MKSVKLPAILALAMVSSIVIAQDQFDRIYKTNGRQMISLDAVSSANGEYFILSKLIPEDRELDSLGLNVTKLKHKGDVDWSLDYYFEDSLQIETYGSIIISPDGGLIVGGILQDTSLRNDKIVMKLDGSGNIAWAFTYSGELQAENNTDEIALGNLNESSFLLAGGQAVEEGTGIYFARLDLNGQILWSQTMDILTDPAEPVTESVTDPIFTLDSNIIFAGTRGVSPSSIFLTKMDTNGQVLFGSEFSIPEAQNKSIGAYDIVELPDTSYVISGFHADLQTFVNSGLVMRIDSLGNLMWAKRISFGEFVARTVTNHIALMENGNLAISGVYFNISQTTPVEFILSITTSGLPIWQNQFSGTVGQVEFSELGELLTTSNPGVALVSSVIDTVETDSVRLIPHLVKVDLEGSSSCEDTISLNVLEDVAMNQDTLIWTATTFDSLSDLVVLSSQYGDFDVPILSLPDTSYCPGDPIMFPLDATTEGAVAYQWTTAEDPNRPLSTDSIYIASEVDVQYIAMVRVEEDVCFTLCDTTTISDIDPPMASIAANYGNYCNERQILLFLQASGQIDSIEWSTGDTGTGQIIVEDLGTYRVTVTNQCGDTGEANITLREADLPPADAVVIQPNDNNLCTTGEIILTVTAPPGLADIVWSTGETGPQISVSEPGTYSAMGTDDCMYEVEGEIEVVQSDFLDIVDIELQADLDNCANGQIVIDLLGVGEDVDVVTWSTGVSNVVRISVTEPGIYSVTAVDICGNSFDASIDITGQQLVECGRTIGDPCPEDDEQCLCFPNVFGPRSESELNQTFGPDNRCPNVTEFELRIYNRWGQEVFQSNDINNEWDGDHGGDDAQGDVYVYFVRYVADGVEFSSKGDVTLIR